MRPRFIPSDSWFVRSCHVPIPCLLIRLSSLTLQLSTALWYLCIAWTATFLSCVNAPCPRHSPLTLRRKEEQADEWGKSQPGLGILNTVSIYALQFTLCTFLS